MSETQHKSLQARLPQIEAGESGTGRTASPTIRSKRRGFAEFALGAILAAVVLIVSATNIPLIGDSPLPLLGITVLCASAAAPPLWLMLNGGRALRGSGMLEKQKHLDSRRSTDPDIAGAEGRDAAGERALLEVLHKHGEVSPLRVALETPLTVSESERRLRELAEQGHLDVRVLDGKLVYSI